MIKYQKELLKIMYYGGAPFNGRTFIFEDKEGSEEYNKIRDEIKKYIEDLSRFFDDLDDEDSFGLVVQELENSTHLYFSRGVDPFTSGKDDTLLHYKILKNSDIWSIDHIVKAHSLFFRPGFGVTRFIYTMKDLLKIIPVYMDYGKKILDKETDEEERMYIVTPESVVDKLLDALADIHKKKKELMFSDDTEIVMDTLFQNYKIKIKGSEMKKLLTKGMCKNFIILQLHKVLNFTGIPMGSFTKDHASQLDRDAQELLDICNTFREVYGDLNDK